MLHRTSSPGSFSSSLIGLQATIQSTSSSSTPYDDQIESLPIHPSFVTALSETNLNLHKSNFPSSRETKLKHVDAFIQHQKILLKRDQELRLKTMAEIQSMIPLDTSIHDGLIRDETPLSTDPPLRTRSTPLQRQKRHSIFSAFEGKKRWSEAAGFLSFRRPSLRRKVDPADSSVKERGADLIPFVDGLVAFRYPKMIRTKVLHQVTTVQEEDEEVEEEEEEEEDSLYKYSKRYRVHSKRFSDPGSGLSAPPFPIGRPLSSFYS